MSEAQRTQDGWHKVALSQVKKLASSLARHTGQVEKEVTGQVAISSPAALSSSKREQSVCMICQKKFQSNKNLKRHTVVHEIKRCEKDREIGVECGKNVQSKKDLKNHQKSHKKVNEIDALA